VTVLDITRGDPKVADKLEAKGVRYIIGSLDDPEALAESVPGHDVVYNLASAFRDIHQGSDLFQRVDVDGTRRLLEASREAGVRRVVHCSTQGVHGSLPRREAPGDEDSPITPIDYYCVAKVDAEKVCEEFIEQGMDIVILRPTSIYGPGDTHGWLKLFRMCRKGRFVMIGSGRTHNHPVYVENLSQAFLLAADAPAASGKAYLIGDAEYVTLNELVRKAGEVQGRKVRMIRFPWYWPVHMVAWAMEIVSRPFGWEPPLFRRRLTWFTTNRAWKLDRARRDLGYDPAIDLDEGLRRTMEWYRSEGLL
jgi:nucleoside-diphosphate-sugar epimerase